jgi:hypothetical protein
MQCKELESELESGRLGWLSAEAREHLGSCVSCRCFLADLETIVSLAKTIPAEVEPPARVWVSLRAQLEAEGLLKEDVEVTEPDAAPRWEWLRMLSRPRSLATAGALLAVVLTAVYFMRVPSGGKPSFATNQPAPATLQPGQPVSPPAAHETPVPRPAAAPTAPRKTVVASNSSSGAVPSKVKDWKPSPSESASVATLSGDGPDFSIPGLQPAAGDAPVDAALRQNLRTLNEFIAECEHRLRQNPHDELAREYLNAAYQQKADLIAAMMESARSEH